MTEQEKFKELLSVTNQILNWVVRLAQGETPKTSVDWAELDDLENQLEKLNRYTN